MPDQKPDGARNLDVYQLAHKLALRIHEVSLKFPRFEMFEEGAQVRRSSKSVTALLIEGYRLRKHRNEFLHYLHRAAASADENLEHLDYLHETGSLGDKSVYTELRTEGKCVLLKLNTFILGVERNHSVPYYLRS